MTLLSVNVATALETQPRGKPTGIGKRPTSEPVELRDPGLKHGGLGSALVGDRIGNQRHHGGSDQAVYAFDRAVLDHWQRELGRELPDGAFGENLTTSGVAVDDARLGEKWAIGTAVLQVTYPRIPCDTFRQRIGEPGWLRRFTLDARPGAYLRVVSAGTVRAGDDVTVVHRPEHAVTVSLAFRAITTERDLLPALLAAGDDLGPELRATVETG